MIGGWEGLNRMRANASLLIAVAAPAEGWNFQGNAITADRMRHDGLAVRDAAMKIKVDHVCGYGRKRTAFHVQEAVLSLSVCITDQLFPYDLRNELAGQHLMTLHSPKSGDNVGDPDFRSLWVNAYYRVQRITPISISAPKLPEQEIYVRKLLVLQL